MMVWVDEAAEYRETGQLQPLSSAQVWTAPAGTPPPVTAPERAGWSRATGVEHVDWAESMHAQIAHRLAFEHDLSTIRRATSCTPAEAADLRAAALALVPDMHIAPWQLIALDQVFGVATVRADVRRGLAVAVRAAHDQRSMTPAQFAYRLGLTRRRQSYQGGAVMAIDSSTVRIHIEASTEAAVRAFADFVRELDECVTVMGGLRQLAKQVRRHQLGQRQIARAMGHRARRADRRRRHAASRAARMAARR